MTTNILIASDTGSNISQFITDVLKDVNLADQSKVQFETAFIAITGLNGNKFNLKGSFEYSPVIVPPATEPSTEIDTLLGGTVTSVTLIQNPGIVQYTVFNSFSIDVNTMLDIIKTGSADDFLALLGDVNYVGGDGADIFTAGATADEIFGGLGGDTLKGGDGTDLIEGGGGADVLAGGGGNDTLTYATSASKVSVDLAGIVSGGDAAGDIISGFENVTGSAFDDVLSGTLGANILEGGKGDDLLWGGGGADQLIGGGDSDTASYANSRIGVIINLETGTASGGNATGDVLTQIENLIGSSGSDTLTGSDGANVLTGGGGADILDGGVNADRLEGGSGRDRLIGGQGVDTLLGRGGGDTFVLANLAASADIIVDFEEGRDTLEINALLFGGGLTADIDLTAAQLEINTTGLASTKDVRFVLNTLTGELFYDVNGSGGGEIGSRLVATLQGSSTGFSEHDFAII